MTHIFVCCVTKLFSRYLVAEHWAFLTAILKLCHVLFFALLFNVRQNKQNAVLALRLQADVGAVR